MGVIKKIYSVVHTKWFGYIFALGIAALVTWFKLLAEPDIIPANIPILYILAIVLTATFFGLGPSILCCLISVVAYDYFFLPPLHSFLSFHILEVPIALIFLFIGVVLSYLSSRIRQRTAEARKELAARIQRDKELVSYREHLEDLVKQRTADLEKSNLELNNEIAAHKKDEEALRKVQEELEVHIHQRTRELAEVNKGFWKSAVTTINDAEKLGFFSIDL